jgi:hypothetical protein
MLQQERSRDRWGRTQPPKKLLIVGAFERRHDGAGPGRIRLQEVCHYPADSLHPFIAQNLAPTGHRQNQRVVRFSRRPRRQT